MDQPTAAKDLVATPLRALADPTLTAPSCAHLMLFVALEGTNTSLGLPASNMWIAPSHEADVLCDASAANYSEAPFPAVFLSFPSTKDPQWPQRYPGKATAHIIAEAPWALFAQWEHTRVHHRGSEVWACHVK